MPRYSESEIQDSRNKLIQSASALFREKGYNGVGLVEIAESAGLTKGTFYAHFKTKRDLFNEIIKITSSHRNTYFLSLQKMTSVEKAHCLINWYLGDKHYVNEKSGCLMPRLASDLKDHRNEKYLESSTYILEFINYFKQCELTSAQSELLASSLVGGLTMARVLGGSAGLAFIKRIRIDLIKLTNSYFKSSS